MSSQQSNLAPTTAKRRHWSIPHIVAVALAIAAYFLIYSMTGDSDLFLALATGAGGGAVVWILLEVEYWFRRRSVT